MKIFNKGASWDTKVNFVDENNVVVGYDTVQSCCENADWYITDATDGHKPDSPKEACPFDVGPYRIDPDYFKELSHPDLDSGGMVEFRLVADGLKELRLVLFNCHNGYYSHGFTMDVGGISKQKGSL